MAYLSEIELSTLGFKSLGANVLISDKASIYNPSKIEIGNNVRIDDFCVLSAGEGGIVFGNYIHVGVYSSLIGAAKIQLDDYSNISSRVSIYSSNDDYSGSFMTNPMVPSHFTNVNNQTVFIGKHVIVGSGSVILPGVKLETGVAIGSLSLITGTCTEFGIYAGIPAKRIKERYRDLLKIESEFKKGS